MHITDLTSGTLVELRARRPYPAVTVALPVHRRQRLNSEDPVRLRNLVAEAKRRLEADPAVSREARFEVAGQLDRAVAEVDFRHSLDGLVLFAAHGENHVWDLPRTVPERVVLSDTFETRNLVAAREQAHPYWVLAVSLNLTTLWSGSFDEIRKAETGDFPMEPDVPQPDPEHQERVGDRFDPLRGEEARRYFRQVDVALHALLAENPRPFHLVGLPQELSLLDDVGTTAKSATGRVHSGGLANGPAPALAQELRPVLAAEAVHEIDRVTQRIENAQGRKVFAAGLDEVWQTVREGRIDLLAVEDGFQRTVVVTDSHLLPSDSEAAVDLAVREDIVDEIIEATLDTGGEVVFLPDGTLSAHDHIAAVLRF
ncbi:baeRF3 domain-containing protein [Actinacidiphila soli]|uniref:baeRF3 domain-containing protein n=1 Tax=Actinacidiphila soli TaxID=2487275 RepID=UPI000FCBBBB2|nr:chemotaxis protein [Actinacidiphila soli]